jgi:serine/threonine protein kinase
MAPESITDRVYSFKTDVYSFAITMWELIARDDPYPNLDTVGAAMKVCYEGLRPEIPEHGEQDLKEVSVFLTV